MIFTRVLVATNDRDDLRSVWAVVAERFGDHDVPSTLVGVTVSGTAINSLRSKPLQRSLRIDRDSQACAGTACDLITRWIRGSGRELWVVRRSAGAR